MERKKAFSVNQRLSSLGIAALAGFAAMIGVGWYQNAAVENSLRHSLTLRDSVSRIDDLRVTNLRMILAAMDSLVDKDKLKVDPERIDIMTRSVDELQAAAPVVKSVAAETGKSDDIATYDADVTEMRSILVGELPKLIESNAGASSLDKIDDTIDEAGGRLTSLFETLSEAGKKVADKTVADATTISRNAVYLQLGLGLAGFLIMAILFPVHSRAIRNGIAAVRDSLVRMRNDDLDTPVQGRERGDEFGDMARAAEDLRVTGLEKRAFGVTAQAEREHNERERSQREDARREEAAEIRKAVDMLANGLSHLADGDLTVAIREPFRDDLERVRQDFNRTVEKLQSVIADVKGNSGSIEANASQMRAAADDLARRTEQQAASLEQTSAALEEITATVRKSSSQAEDATRLVEATKSGAEQSGKVVSEAMAAMERIESASNEIGKIINVIDEIAFQTNLLALNAGVEAARAGEAGKGFAVVAQEVRELAGRAAGAAKDIKSLVARSSSEVKTGVDLVSATRDALGDIAREVSTINEIVRHIAVAASEQSVGIEQINTAIGQMDQMTQKNAAMVEETNAASHTLATDAQNLTSMMGQFQIGGASAMGRMETSSGARLATPSTPSSFAKPQSTFASAAKPAVSRVKPASEASRPKFSPAKGLVDRLTGAFGSKAAASSADAQSNANNWEEF